MAEARYLVADRKWSAATSRWGRVLGAGGGMAMIVGGLLELEGYRWGWMLVVAAAAAGGLGHVGNREALMHTE
jgi:hypothetical protein